MPRSLKLALFLLVTCLSFLATAFGQSITSSTALHYRNYDPTQPQMVIAAGSVQTGDIFDFVNSNGILSCAVLSDGLLNATCVLGGLGTALGPGQYPTGVNLTNAAIATNPFDCLVESGTAFTEIAQCISQLTAGGATGGNVKAASPEHITALPWDPATASGNIYLGFNNEGSQCTDTQPNCWITDVPIVINSGQAIEGVGNVTGGTNLSGGIAEGANISAGTILTWGSTYPAPLGQPTLAAPTCSGTGGTLNTVYIAVAEVVNLNTYPSSNLKAPAPSYPSAVATVSCSGATSILIAHPASLGSASTLTPTDYYIFASTSSSSLSALTLQAVTTGLSCTAGSTDPTYACALTANATLTAVQTGGDPPKPYDFTNTLVSEWGPGAGSGTTSQHIGFWSELRNLTLTAGPSAPTTNTPNIAFWDPSDQENSGLRNVATAGNWGSTVDCALGGGVGVYVGNKSPNSHIYNWQTDTAPFSNYTANDASCVTFTELVLDGNTGFGSAQGTARIVQDSTLTPGRAGSSAATTVLGALVTGSKAFVDFKTVHFEVNPAQGEDVSVTNSAHLKTSGAGEFGNFAELTSTGGSLVVDNCNTTTGNFCVKNDITGTQLNTSVPSYDSTLYADALQLPQLLSQTLATDSSGNVIAGKSTVVVYTSNPTGDCLSDSTAAGCTATCTGGPPTTACTEVAFASTYTIPAGVLITGVQYRVTIGYKTVVGSTAQTADIKLRAASASGTDICGFAASTTLASTRTGQAVFLLGGTAAAGSGASVNSSCTGGLNGGFLGGNTTTPVTLNTTTGFALVPTALFGIGGTANEISITTFTVEELP